MLLEMITEANGITAWGSGGRIVAMTAFPDDLLRLLDEEVEFANWRIYGSPAVDDGTMALVSPTLSYEQIAGLDLDGNRMFADPEESPIELTRDDVEASFCVEYVRPASHAVGPGLSG